MYIPSKYRDKIKSLSQATGLPIRVIIDLVVSEGIKVVEKSIERAREVVNGGAAVSV